MNKRLHTAEFSISVMAMSLGTTAIAGIRLLLRRLEWAGHVLYPYPHNLYPLLGEAAGLLICFAVGIAATSALMQWQKPRPRQWFYPVAFATLAGGFAAYWPLSMYPQGLCAFGAATLCTLMLAFEYMTIRSFLEEDQSNTGGILTEFGMALGDSICAPTPGPETSLIASRSFRARLIPFALVSGFFCVGGITGIFGFIRFGPLLGPVFTVVLVLYAAISCISF